ncbi:class I SAM-dependent methyltransferase [Chloroflexota bacterium]
MNTVLGRFKIQQDMLTHFSQVAPSYRLLRQTDLEPIMFMKEIMDGNVGIEAADIGCGAGRYCLKFLQHLGISHLTCIDSSEAMLKEAASCLEAAGMTNFKTVQSLARDIPLADGSMDCIFCFNAIHHFDCVRFLKKAAMVTRAGGRICVYTRLGSENAKNIWGRYFPLFLEKENRLYELDELEKMAGAAGDLNLEHVRQFRYPRVASLNRLVDLARSAHYSTFSLYKGRELEESIKGFRENIKKNYNDLKKIEWSDENTLLVLRKNG